MKFFKEQFITIKPQIYLTHDLNNNGKKNLPTILFKALLPLGSQRCM